MTELNYGPPPKKGEVLYVHRVLNRGKWKPCLSRPKLPHYESVEFPYDGKVTVSCACCPKNKKRATLKHYASGKKPGEEYYWAFSFEMGARIVVEDYISKHSVAKVKFREGYSY